MISYQPTDALWSFDDTTIQNKRCFKKWNSRDSVIFLGTNCFKEEGWWMNTIDLKSYDSWEHHPESKWQNLKWEIVILNSETYRCTNYEKD